MNATEGLKGYTYTVLALVLTVVALYFGRDLILLGVVSGLFAFLTLPLARKLERWMPRWAGALIATLLLLLILLGILFLLGWQFTRFGKELPLVQERLTEKSIEVQRWIAQQTNFSRREQLDWINEHVSDFTQWSGAALMALFTSTGSVLASVAPIPIFVFLLLALKDRFRIFFTKLGRTRDGVVLDIMVHISELSRKYLKGMLTVALIFGALCSIGFLVIGLKYAVLLGVLLALLNVIPYVGALVGSLLPMVVSLLTHGSLPHALAALGVVLFVQFLDNNFITPKVVGSSVSINPLASLLALIGFGMLWGVAGMALAIPLTGMLKVVCDSIPSLHAWGYLLGEEIETPQEKRFHLPLPRRTAKPAPADTTAKK